MSNITMTSPQTIYLFSHGLANYGSRQAHSYMKSYKHPITGSVVTNDLFLMDGIVIHFDFPDALHIPPFVNPFHANLGQLGDVFVLKKQYEKVLKQYPDANIVLFGMSRGAVTIINFLGIFKPTRVSAVVLESPYDCGKSIFDAVQKQLGTHVSTEKEQDVLEFIFKEYDRNGLQAIDFVNKIPHHIPMLFVCSERDQRVPFTSTQKLCHTLREAGHNDCYLFTAKYGKHFDILWNRHGLLYQHIVHSFYKHYGLDYDDTYAQHADLLLSYCKK